MARGLQHFSCKETKKELMFSLEKRKLKKDLIVTFQSLKGLLGNIKKYFSPGPVGFCVVFIMFPELWLSINNKV